jgi:hypothetical protein
MVVVWENSLGIGENSWNRVSIFISDNAWMKRIDLSNIHAHEFSQKD